MFSYVDIYIYIYITIIKQSTNRNLFQFNYRTSQSVKLSAGCIGGGSGLDSDLYIDAVHG